MTNDKPFSKKELTQFRGSTRRYRHAVNWAVGFTEGAKYVADAGCGYWILYKIALLQRDDKKVAAEAFQLWRLAVRPDHTATLTCEGGNGNVVFTKEIARTDFPLAEITLYFANDTIYLPSEH